MDKIIKEAVKILINNYCFQKRTWIPKKEKQWYREFSIGIYNRLDEIGLIYATLKKISFNEAIKELGIQDYLDEIKVALEGRGEKHE